MSNKAGRFEAIPAVDLKGGKCVRLKQGRMDDETIFSDDPVTMARKWQDMGAARMHVVDLDGAVEGRPANAPVIAEICEALDIPVQLGGGVRDLAGLEAAFGLGIDRMIIGTMAANQPDVVLEGARRFPGKVVIGIDARDGMVATSGWVEITDMHFVDLARKYDIPEVAAFVFTDIARDGMHTGPNLESTLELCRAVSRPVIVAGGVHDLKDVEDCLELRREGLAGFITGRAIYEGTLDFVKALEIIEKA